MALRNILAPDLIRLRFEASDKWELLTELTDLLLNSPHVTKKEGLDRRAIHEAVLSRERSQTAAMGHGLVLLSVRVTGIENPAACLVTLAKPMEYDAPDHLPIRIAGLLLVPEDEHAPLTLQAVAELVSLLLDEHVRAFIESTQSAQDVYEYLMSRRAGDRHPICARIIMRPPFFHIYPDTPLTEVTRLMEAHRLDAACVVERDGSIAGEITCDVLFRSGLPEFFGQLKSVAFLKNFDPFEDYFRKLKTAVAGDVMSKTFAAVTEDTTVLEVIFELAVHRHTKVYVARDGKLVGIIDRSAVLSRIINF